MFQPDYRYLESVARNVAARIPLYEHLINSM